jgi:hypothetical protein
MVVGRDEDYATTTAYYWCGNPKCSAFKCNPVHPENPHVPPNGSFDWEVIATVCVIRWSNHCTYEEIVAELASRHSIRICQDTVERFLKTYEIACEARYRPAYVEKIRANGGVIVRN